MSWHSFSINVKFALVTPPEGLDPWEGIHLQIIGSKNTKMGFMRFSKKWFESVDFPLVFPLVFNWGWPPMLINEEPTQSSIANNFLLRDSWFNSKFRCAHTAVGSSPTEWVYYTLVSTFGHRQFHCFEHHFPDELAIRCGIWPYLRSMTTPPRKFQNSLRRNRCVWWLNQKIDVCQNRVPHSIPCWSIWARNLP